MKRVVLVSTLVGFLMPIGWGALGWVLFDAPQSRLADLYWDAVHITAPAWVMTPPSNVREIATPFLNALFYGVTALVLTAAARTVLRCANANARR